MTFGGHFSADFRIPPGLFFSIFGPKGTTELYAAHILNELLCKCASEPRKPPKIVAQRLPKGATKVPKRPSEPQKYLNIDPQSLQTRLEDYQPTIQSPKKTKLQDYKTFRHAMRLAAVRRWAGGSTQSV